MSKRGRHRHELEKDAWVNLTTALAQVLGAA